MAVAAAFLLRWGLTRLAGGSLPTYITFYPAVMLSALLGGLGPGLLATVVAALGVDYFILLPQGSFAVSSLADAVGLAFFTGTGVFMSVVAELYRRARQQAAAQETEALLRDHREAPARWTRQGLLINAGLVVSLAILAAAGWQSAQSLRAVEEGDKSVARAYSVIQDFDRLISALKDEETGQRGYLLTGDERYLEPYEAALSQVQINLAGLKQMATGNAAHHQRLADIEALILEKEAVLKQTVELRRSQGLPAALEIVKTDHGKNLMDQIRNQVAEAQEDMNRVLQSQAAARNTDTGKTLQALLAGGVLSIILLVTVFLFLKQENLRRTKAEADARHHRDHLQQMVAARTEELGQSNEQLKKEVAGHQQAREALGESRERLDLALASARMAIFEWDIVKNKRNWSPGVHRLLGTKEETFTGSAEEFFQIMHPEDRSAVQAALARAVETTGVYETEYRAVWPDGGIHHIAARGKTHRDHGGRAVLMTGLCWDITDLKRAEETRTQLAAIVEGSDDAILSKDLDGSITSWNAGAERLFGYRHEEVMGRSIRLLLPPDRQGEEDSIMARLQEGEQVAHFETVRLTKDGRSLSVSVTISPLRDGGGRIIGASKIVRDISERKRKEEELQKLNRTLKALQESSQAMTRATSETEYLQEVCKIVIANCGHAMVWIGFAEQDEARSVRPVAHAGFEEGYLKTLQISWADNERGRGPTGTAIRTGKPSQCKNMPADPAFAPWRAEAVNHGYASSLVVPLLSEGRAFGAISIYSRQADGFSEDEARLLAQLAEDVSNCVRSLRAVSQRQRAERRTELLAETASRLLNSDDPQRVVDELCGKVLEFLNCQVFFNFLVDEKRQRLHLNACAGIGQQEAAKFEWLDHCAAVCGNAAREGCRFVAGSIQETPDPRTELVKGYGIEAYACHPLMAAGAFLGTLSFGTRTRKDFIEEELSLMKAVADLMVTAIGRKRAQAALQLTAEEVKRSNRDLEQFAYIASHDLQEPLRAVGGYVKLLERRFPQNMDPKALEYIHGAADGAERMERLISDLLAYSRVGTRGEIFSPADLDAILNEAMRNLQNSIGSTGAKITRGAMPALAVDATQMMQVFQNLIGNAIKFRGERPPEIHVGAEKQPGRWVFSVRDNGIGIEPQYFERIFQIFQRLHTRRHYSGTGIGLAICKRIVERHDGAIWVESEPGQGSTFFFSLPDISAINPHDV
jgi:PAS domain S-box-containing protein